MTDILTITLNPAMDVTTTTDRLLQAHKLRCAKPHRFAGGGGINVARVLHRLGREVQALYFGGGSNGQQLARLLAAEAVPARCLSVRGEARESFSVLEASTGKEYRFVKPGPTVQEQEWQACVESVCGMQPGRTRHVWPRSVNCPAWQVH